MSSDVAVPGTVTRKYRHQIPTQYRLTIDTRLTWLWNQRFGTVQQVWLDPLDADDKLAATIILQSIITPTDLNSIALLFKRLEGGSLDDETTLDGVLTL